MSSAMLTAPLPSGGLMATGATGGGGESASGAPYANAELMIAVSASSPALALATSPRPSRRNLWSDIAASPTFVEPYEILNRRHSTWPDAIDMKVVHPAGRGGRNPQVLLLEIPAWGQVSRANETYWLASGLGRSIATWQRRGARRQECGHKPSFNECEADSMANDTSR